MRKKLPKSPIPQLIERLIAVTGGEVIHIRLPEKSEGSRDG